MTQQKQSVDYPSFLHALCLKEKVLIIPEFLTVFKNQALEIVSPTKSKESSLPEEREVSFAEYYEIVDDNDFLLPPQIKIIYEIYEHSGNPTSIICKNIYIEYSLIHALEKSLAPFPTITSLKIEDCCISKELAKELAKILAEESGRQISELSLDGNSNIGEVAPLFLSASNGLKVFSFERCGLKDDEVKLLAQSLGDIDKGQKSLLVLNLGINKIGNIGAAYLADALRTNRTLISLSLVGNQIEDQGASHIAEVLKKFSLTDEEISFRRRKLFNDIIKKSNIEEKSSEKRIGKNEIDREATNSNFKTLERLGATSRKFRGADGKLCLQNREKRSKTNLVKLKSEEKFGEKIKQLMEDNRKNSTQKLPEFLTQQNINDSSDSHPFFNEVFPSNGKLWCNGCWSLLNLNVAYNNLTEKSVEKFVEVFLYQFQTFNSSQKGLLKITITPGNFIKEDSTEMINLHKVLMQKASKREFSSLDIKESSNYKDTRSSLILP